MVSSRRNLRYAQEDPEQSMVCIASDCLVASIIQISLKMYHVMESNDTQVSDELFSCSFQIFCLLADLLL